MSEEYLPKGTQKFLDLMPTGLALFDRTGTELIYANPAALDLMPALRTRSWVMNEDINLIFSQRLRSSHTLQAEIKGIPVSAWVAWDYMVAISFAPSNQSLGYQSKGGLSPDDFAFVAGHDLMEPARTMKSFAGLLRNEISKGNQKPEQTERYLHFIEVAADRMSDMVEDLLRYSRIGAGGSVTTIHLNDMLQGKQLKYSQRFSDVGGQMELGELPVVQGFENELSQLFEELIENSLQFRSPDRPLRCLVAMEGSAIVFRDNGIGVDPMHISKVTQIFRRLHRRKEIPGNGIGLAICTRVMELHQGRLEVESEGEGLTVRLLFPESALL